MGEPYALTVSEGLEDVQRIEIQARWYDAAGEETDDSLDAAIAYMGPVHMGESWAVWIHWYVDDVDGYEQFFCSSEKMARDLIARVIDVTHDGQMESEHGENVG